MCACVVHLYNKRKMSSDDEMEGEEEGVVVGEMPTAMVPRHIKKGSLRNKALAVSFDEKELQDYVSGFHKRKKKRRKEAQKQLAAKERSTRIEARKRRKEAKEIALYGRILSPEERAAAALHETSRAGDAEENSDLLPFISSETKTYDDGSTRVVVTTSEISCNEDVHVSTPALADSQCGKPGHVNATLRKQKLGLGVKRRPQKKKLSRSKKPKKGKGRATSCKDGVKSWGRKR